MQQLQTDLRNIIGIKDWVVDSLIDKVISSTSREDLIMQQEP